MLEVDCIEWQRQRQRWLLPGEEVVMVEVVAMALVEVSDGGSSGGGGGGNNGDYDGGRGW